VSQFTDPFFPQYDAYCYTANEGLCSRREMENSDISEPKYPQI